MSELGRLTAASIPGANRVRFIQMSEEEIFARAREATILSFPKLPQFVARMIRRGRFDWLLRPARQVIRDIEKPLDHLTTEARAAFVLSTILPTLKSLDDSARGEVVNAITTAVRVGVRH